MYVFVPKSHTALWDDIFVYAEEHWPKEAARKFSITGPDDQLITPRGTVFKIITDEEWERGMR